MHSFPHPAGITTLHRLLPDAWPAMEEELRTLTLSKPVTLILPCHARELGTHALSGIITELTRTPWIDRIIVGLDAADEADTAAAHAHFAPLPQLKNILCTSAPEILALERDLAESGFTTATSGKGRNVWLCAGLALAHATGPTVIALHDCDIKNYHRSLPGRLCRPVLDPRWAFRFNKGFYSRHSDRLHGRLQRLLVRPLLQAMELRAGPMGILQFLSAFRYPLAGESALDAGLLRQLNIPASWGLEIGLLEEVRRHLPPPAICQTELCGAYDHKHHDLSPDNPEEGLHRMAREVSGTLLACVSGGTYPWREEIASTWETRAADALRHAEAESVMNDLPFSREDEALAVSVFSRALQAAIELPAPPALLPSWESVEKARPDILTTLMDAAASTPEKYQNPPGAIQG